MEIEDKDSITYRYKLYFKQIPMDITSYNDKNLNIKNFKGIRPCTDKSLTSSIKLSQYYV